jgi:CHAT domain-containing protein
VPLGSTGLVVGDPDTGGGAGPLPSARVEGPAIRQAFYRGAKYLGRLPDDTTSPSGAGTPDQVRAWLTAPEPYAGAMLHLACHGAFDTSPGSARSALLLASSTPDGELDAEEIVTLLAAHPRRHIGLVVLAACHTGRSVHGYDEAYSLGTAFLAGGVRSVLSTQWSVPDAATSPLMYVFHRNCRVEKMPPWQALQHAQVWMLDPGREIPQGMPPELARAVPAGAPAAVASWAGFVHYGQ